MLMENTQNPPFLHVKRENTRKTGTKMVENTLFSQIDKILKIYPRLDEYISFPFVPGSRTGFNPFPVTVGYYPTNLEESGITRLTQNFPVDVFQHVVQGYGLVVCRVLRH